MISGRIGFPGSRFQFRGNRGKKGRKERAKKMPPPPPPPPAAAAAVAAAAAAVLTVEILLEFRGEKKLPNFLLLWYFG